jgi:hypothetical protein
VKKGDAESARAILESMSKSMQQATVSAEASRKAQADQHAQVMQALTASQQGNALQQQKQLEFEEQQLLIQQQALQLKQQEPSQSMSMRPQQEHAQKCLNVKSGAETLMTMLSAGDVLPQHLRQEAVKKLEQLMSFDFLGSASTATPAAAFHDSGVVAHASAAQTSHFSAGLPVHSVFSMQLSEQDTFNTHTEGQQRVQNPTFTGFLNGGHAPDTGDF